MAEEDIKNGNPDIPPAAQGPEKENPEQDNKDPKPKRHLIKPRWLRITLKTLMWVVIAVLLVPVLLYIPPVQTLVKNVACNVVRKSTGMDIGIGEFRLKFPLDVSLRDVTVVEATGDTMARVGELIADVKLLPLLSLDARINKLDLLGGYYRMVSPDSSMVLKLKAGLVTVDDRSSADLASMKISLHRARIQDGDLSLFMDVWKQKPTPKDTTSAPFFISADDLVLDNFRFAMSMLPTIDTLTFDVNKLEVRKGVVDLGKNLVTASSLKAMRGNAVYLTPDTAWVRMHPAPEAVADSTPAPPMVIKGDKVVLDSFTALYAMKGTEPLAGFDPSYIQVSDVNVDVDNFYNAASTLRLPITRIEATERSGLRIMQGNGTVALDDTGITLDSLNVTTLWSELHATAGIPFALMQLEPSAPLDVRADGHLGLPDIEAFMPDVKQYTANIPRRNPVDFNVNIDGTLGRASINKLDVGLEGVAAVTAKGRADNILDIDRLNGNLDFTGTLTDPQVVDGLMGKTGVRLPRLRLTGDARARGQVYDARFKVASEAGDITADGAVALNPETYRADLSVHNLNIGFMMPGTGVGALNARLTAKGAGFDPTRPQAHTDIVLDVAFLQYHRQLLTDIKADIKLHDGVFDIAAVSRNAAADFNIQGTGTVAPDLYTFDVSGYLNNLDLHAIGLTPEANSGHGGIKVTGSASPEKWLYDVNLSVNGLEWLLGNQVINLPGEVAATFRSGIDKVTASASARLTDLNFTAASGLKPLLDSFTLVGDSLTRQVERRNVDIAGIQRMLPPFDLDMTMSGQGTVGRYLNTMGISLDTLWGSVRNDSLVHARIEMHEISNGTTRADTLSLALDQRGEVIDYLAHMGNRPNNPIGEFADVNVRGYLGLNRALVSLSQKNQKRETGYRLGMTLSFADSVASLHFTPLKATIAYLPWQFNAENYIDYNFASKHLGANLIAESRESKIHLVTAPGKDGNDEVSLAISNLKIQDFLQMSVFAPPVTATVNADLKVGYTRNWLYGGGNLGITDFTYDRLRVGDFDLRLGAARNDDGTSVARGALKIDGADALSARVKLVPDSVTHDMAAENFGLQLTRFPLYIANAFIGNDVARLSGSLSGGLAMKGSFTAPVLNGALRCDSVGVFIPMIGSQLRFDNDSVTVADNVIAFNDFDIWGANKNPLVINGTVDARHLSKITFDLGLKGENFQLMGNDKNARSDMYGKLFADINASARGPMQHFSVNADVTVLPRTDLTYVVSAASAQLTAQDAADVVKFVNFNDTTKVIEADTVAPAMSMRIVAALNLEPGAKIQVILPSTAGLGGGKVELSPNGKLNYFQNYMGDMRLNGQLFTGPGFARYSIPVSGEKKFDFNPQSYVLFNGDIMNPVLSLEATDVVKANLIQNGNSRLVNFNVGLNISNTLSAPKVGFNLSTEDDMTIENDLLSMSADQRSMTAINLLLTGQYSVQGVKTASSDLLGNMSGVAYGLLTSQLNGWLANHVKGIDLSFGVDQYERTVDGQTGQTTSYSYQMSKSLFDNKFKISVGGNYTTDASADENFSENLISDISFEYMLRQTANSTIYARLFRHTGYESILEGEITEMGVGFVYKRRLATLRDLFRLGRRHRESLMPIVTSNPKDTVATKKSEDDEKN